MTSLYIKQPVAKKIKIVTPGDLDFVKKGAPNLNDVAQEAGVSKSTVSRILNNRLGNGFTVKEEVRLRVLEVARRMNYRPNLIAKSLTLRSTRMVHILGGNHALSDLGNIYQTVVNHVTQVIDAASEGYDVTVDMSRHAPDDSEMPAWRVDGVIILATCTAATLEDIVQMGIPYVVVNGPAPEGGIAVVPDDIGGTRTAVEHLVELGHTRIAYSGPLPPSQEEIDRANRAEYRTQGLESDILISHSSVGDRYQTYLAQMHSRGLEPLLYASEAKKSAEDYLQEMVLEKGVTAVLTYGHMGALNLLQAAHSLEIAVPRQLSVMCFCDEYANRVMSPGLTFIDLSSARMGQTAAELLLEQIRHPGTARQNRIVLQETLVKRNTTAPPPQA